MSSDRSALRSNALAILAVLDVEPTPAEKVIVERKSIAEGLITQATIPVEQSTSLLQSPIRRIPYEILAMIFKHRLDADEFARHTEPMPLVLSRVCRLWRKIMLSNSSLWSSIRFEPDQQTIWSLSAHELPRRQETFWFQSTVDFSLHLSGQSPLKVSMGWKPLASTATVKLLSSHVHRLQHVELEQRFSAISPLLRAIANDSPLLESLAITLYRDQTRVYLRPGVPPRPLLVHDIKHFQSPKLRHLTILTTCLPFFLPFPWSQLTHLRVGDYSSEKPGARFQLWRCYDALHQCSSLTHLWLDMADPCRNNPRPQSPISLPNLKFLMLKRTRSDSIFFESLVAPRLKVLEYGSLSCGTLHYFPLVESFERFLSRSPCLTALSLQTSHPTSADIVAFLRCLPGLTDFRLDYYSYDNIGCASDLIAALAYRHDDLGASLLPQLQRFYTTHVPDVCEDPLIRMITSRCPLSANDGHSPFPHPLRLVRIHADEDQGRRIASLLNLPALTYLEFDVLPPEKFPPSFTWSHNGL
ncbi:hypothetical protein JAAARDRAFT_202390 [Jaapia argillacea MUCL 33604]|uniref:F-box domain-containing protein n=1 Tax=Jaapia argillacea MUCL 33604 TaxID=933084 RepID=A0A067QDZ2_9AGAM|nr:hypothetical protein JAAARDRAFT_202390 [Jaapia argillacea MUCL 33604]